MERKKGVLFPVLLLACFSFISFTIWGVVKIRKFKEERKNQEVGVVVPSPTMSVEPTLAEAPPGFILKLPVEEKYLETAILDKEYSQVLSFFLPAQEPIKAVFSGRITKILSDQKPFPNDASFEEIWLERNDGQFWASYIVAGETLVKEGQEVAEGEVLAKAGEKGLGFRSGTNFSLWLHNRENQMVNLSKEMFK